jgi:hypothetical protein
MMIVNLKTGDTQYNSVLAANLIAAASYIDSNDLLRLNVVIQPKTYLRRVK